MDEQFYMICSGNNFMVATPSKTPSQTWINAYEEYLKNFSKDGMAPSLQNFMMKYSDLGYSPKKIGIVISK